MKPQRRKIRFYDSKIYKNNHNIQLSETEKETTLFLLSDFL